MALARIKAEMDNPNPNDGGGESSDVESTSETSTVVNTEDIENIAKLD